MKLPEINIKVDGYIDAESTFQHLIKNQLESAEYNIKNAKADFISDKHRLSEIDSAINNLQQAKLYTFRKAKTLPREGN